LDAPSQRSGEHSQSVGPPPGPPRPEIWYLCTTFPRLSEAFVEREIQHIATRAPLHIVSLWHGGPTDGLNVEAIPVRSLFKLFGILPLWLLRNPVGLLRLLQRFFLRFPRSFLNLQETLLGMGTGILLAGEIRKHPPRWIHAIWATAPATAALTLHELTGVRFSFGAHAYDLFQNGGDCLLPDKIAAADWIRTTTEASARELFRRGAATEKVVLIRRGLPTLPPMQTPRVADGPLRLLCVGRLVAKKGYPHLLRLCEALRSLGIPFEARIIGDGPQRKDLEARIRQRQLSGVVHLLGALPRAQVDAEMAGSDLFLFMGITSRDGDRDGLPNVVPEAMAHGLPVVVRPAPGVLEAVTDGETGCVLEGEAPSTWAETVAALWQNPAARRTLAQGGRRWVEENFVSARNTEQLAEKILSSPPSIGETRQP